MNRRNFVKTLTSGVAMAFVAPQLILPEQPERRIWQLDSTMTRKDSPYHGWLVENYETEIERWVRLMEMRTTPFLDQIPPARPFDRPMMWGAKDSAYIAERLGLND